MSALIQRTAEWHEERRRGIGSSDAPIITGDSPWGSRRRLYDEKIGDADPLPASPAMRLGTLAEPLIADLYTERTGRPLTEEGTVIRHPSLPWMRASLDRWAPDRIVECKLGSAGSVDWGGDGTDEVPPHVLIQVQHQLAVSGASLADVAALIRGELYVYTVEPDRRLIDLLIEEEAEFWRAVENRQPPAIDGSDATRTYLTSRYPADNGLEMVADEDISGLVSLIWEREAEIERLTEEKQAAQNAIRERMGELSICRGTGFRIDWKRTRDRVETDWESLAAGLLRQMPDEERQALIGLHSRDVAGVRRFRVYQQGKGS